MDQSSYLFLPIVMQKMDQEDFLVIVYYDLQKFSYIVKWTCLIHLDSYACHFLIVFLKSLITASDILFSLLNLFFFLPSHYKLLKVSFSSGS